MIHSRKMGFLHAKLTNEMNTTNTEEALSAIDVAEETRKKIMYMNQIFKTFGFFDLNSMILAMIKYSKKNFV